MFKVTVKTQQQCTNLSIFCGKMFGLIRPSWGQRSKIWGTVSVYNVLWYPILFTRCI